MCAARFFQDALGVRNGLRCLFRFGSDATRFVPCLFGLGNDLLQPRSQRVVLFLGVLGASGGRLERRLGPRFVSLCLLQRTLGLADCGRSRCEPLPALGFVLPFSFLRTQLLVGRGRSSTLRYEGQHTVGSVRAS